MSPDAIANFRPQRPDYKESSLLYIEQSTAEITDTSLMAFVALFGMNYTEAGTDFSIDWNSPLEQFISDAECGVSNGSRYFLKTLLSSQKFYKEELFRFATVFGGLALEKFNKMKLEGSLDNLIREVRSRKYFQWLGYEENHLIDFLNGINMLPQQRWNLVYLFLREQTLRKEN